MSKGFDEKEKIRRFLNLQYVKMKRMAAVGSLFLLAVNLSFVVYPYIEFRLPVSIMGIPRAWIGVPLLLLFIVLLIWLGSHIYLRVFEMYRTETSADITYNPYTVYAITPFEEMLYTYFSIPTLEGVVTLLPDGPEKDKLVEKLEKFRKWIKLGYIPKEDFPVHLQKFYITNKENRL